MQKRYSTHYPWLNPPVPLKYWNKRSNHLQYIQWLSHQLQIKEPQQWYNITREQIEQYPGYSLIHNYYQGSLCKALQAIYPQYHWETWKFHKVSQTFWKDPSNHQEYFDWVSKYLNIKNLDDWYSITRDEMGPLHGLGLLRNYYSGSLSKALQINYPQHKWLPWMFRQPPHGWWNEECNRREYLDWLRQKMDIKEHSQWKELSESCLKKNRGAALLQRYGSLREALGHAYPEQYWMFCDDTGSKREKYLMQILKTLFEKASICFNYLHPQLTYIHSNRPMQLDVFIEGLNLAFEVQGQQHYDQIFRGNYSKQSSRDLEKAKRCKEKGITLITIPYWWDGKDDTLAATIREHRPDMMRKRNPFVR